MVEKAVEEFSKKLCNDIIEFQLFSDIGVNVFSQAVDWFKISTGKYENKWNKQGLDDVKKDATRLLLTYKNEIKSKFEYWESENGEKKDCEILGKKLTDSIEAFIIKSTIDEEENGNCEKISVKEIENVKNAADKLLIFLNDLQDMQREEIIEKLKNEADNLKTRISETSGPSERRYVGHRRVKPFEETDKPFKTQMEQIQAEFQEKVLERKNRRHTEQLPRPKPTSSSYFTPSSLFRSSLPPPPSPPPSPPKHHDRKRWFSDDESSDS